MKIRFLYNFLFINDCEEILFPLDIRGLIQLEDMVIVLIYGSDQQELANLPKSNVYAYNGSAKKIWEIEAPPQSKNRNVAYADISLTPSGDLVAGTTIGTEYIVNVKDGSIAPLCANQRPW